MVCYPGASLRPSTDRPTDHLRMTWLSIAFQLVLNGGANDFAFRQLIRVGTMRKFVFDKRLFHSSKEMEGRKPSAGGRKVVRWDRGDPSLSVFLSVSVLKKRLTCQQTLSARRQANNIVEQACILLGGNETRSFPPNCEFRDQTGTERRKKEREREERERDRETEPEAFAREQIKLACSSGLP